MTWLIAVNIATCITMLGFTLFHLHLYLRDRDGAMGLWTAGWALQFGKNSSDLLMTLFAPTPFLFSCSQGFALSSGLLIYQGTMVFFGRPRPRWLLPLAWAGGALLVILALPFVPRTVPFLLPPYLVNGLLFIGVGVAWMRFRQTGSLLGVLIGAAYIVWGGNKWLYPVLQGDAVYAAARYTLTLMMAGAVVLGSTSSYMERILASLLREKERYRLLFEKSPVGVAMLDAAGGFAFLSANPAFCAMMDRTEEQLRGMSFRDLTPPEDLPAQVREVRRLLMGEIDVLRLEKRYLKRDGTSFWGSLTANLMRDEAGGPRYFLAVVENIDEVRRLRVELAASEQKYHDLFDLASDSLFLVEKEGGAILDANAAASALYGYSREELLHMSNTDLSAEPEKTRAATARHDTHSDSLTIPRRRHKKKDGAVFPVEIAVRFFTWQGRPVHLAAIRDVSLRERSEEELRKAQKLDSLALLAGGIAHDFNNLLTGILGNLSLALARFGDREAEEARLREAERAALRAKELATRLLTFSRGGAPVKQALPLEGVLREAAQRAAEGSSVTLRFDIPPAAWSAWVDGGQFGQVIENLVCNAVEAMPQGGSVTFSAVNREMAEGNPLALPPGRYVEVRVADEGTGISAKDLARIFDPYFTTRAGASGLGLAIVHSVVTRHGGRVEVSSQPGAGAVFTLIMPAAPAAPATPRGPEGEGGGPSRRLAGLRALVMDDETMILDLSRDMLQSQGWRVQTAPDGKTALALYRRAREEGDPFDLVILDLTIPGGMGGQAAIELLRREDPSVRAVVSSGYSNDPVMARYGDYGFAGVLAKPYRLDDLTALLARLFPPAGKSG